jgi:hypothetical protein
MLHAEQWALSSPSDTDDADALACGCRKGVAALAADVNFDWNVMPWERSPVAATGGSLMRIRLSIHD